MARGERGSASATREAGDSPVRLRPASRPWWRGPGEVQFGLDPDCGFRLSGLGPDEILLVHRLAAGWVQEPGPDGDPDGPGPARRRRLLGLLAREGVLETPGGIPRRRATLVLLGTGDVVEAVDHALRTLPTPAPVVLRGEAARELERDLLVVDGPTPARPTLVVGVARDLMLSAATGVWEGLGVPVLPVVVHGDLARVGPLLAPPGPCSTCLEHRHVDQDPGWARVRDQALLEWLAADGAGPGVDVDGPVATQAAAITASVAALVLTEPDEPGRSDDRVPTRVAGLSWEVSAPWPDVVRRRWPRHPACPVCTMRS